MPFTEKEQEIYSEYQNLSKSMKSGLFHIDKEQEKPEMVKYSDRYLQVAKKPPFQHEFIKLNVDLRLFPDELHSVLDKTKRKKIKVELEEIDLSKLEQMEKNEINQDLTISAEQKEEESDAENVEEEFDDEDEGGDDYMVDHYDDDHDAFGNDSEGERDWS